MFPEGDRGGCPVGIRSRISTMPAGSADGKVLSFGQLKRLASHKYSAEGVSVLEPYMQHFWRWLVERIPLWWAPNALTLAGLGINGTTTFLLILYCSDARSQAPRWCYFLCACGLFIYQSLDAIDGKQARRTNSSSPLGELFDHGCDALTIIFVVIGTCLMGQLGDDPQLLFIECFASMFVYYCAHWQTYCSGTLHFGLFDVTEAQICIMLMHLLTSFFGPSIWDIEIFSTGLPMKMIPSVMTLIGIVYLCTDYFYVIFMRGGVGKNGSTVAGTSVISPVFPIGLLISCGFYIWKNSKSAIFECHPVLFIMTFGVAASKLSIKLVVSHMSCSEMDLLDSCLAGPVLMLLNQYFSISNDYHFLWLSFFYCSADLLKYSVQLCVVICDFLNIRCFKIKTIPISNVVSFRPTTTTTVENNKMDNPSRRRESLQHRRKNSTTTSISNRYLKK